MKSIQHHYLRLIILSTFALTLVPGLPQAEEIQPGNIHNDNRLPAVLPGERVTQPNGPTLKVWSTAGSPSADRGDRGVPSPPKAPEAPGKRRKCETENSDCSNGAGNALSDSLYAPNQRNIQIEIDRDR